MKNPLLRVANAEFRRTSSLLALAAAHEIPAGVRVPGENVPGEMPRDDAVPLPGMSAGLDHPPPGWGEGDRDNFIEMIGANRGGGWRLLCNVEDADRVKLAAKGWNGFAMRSE